MPDTMSISLQGVDKVFDKMADVEAVQKVLRDMAERASAAGAQAAIRDLENRGTTLAARSILTGPDKFSGGLSQAYTIMGKARSMSINTGRSPGTSLPLIVVARWLHGMAYARSLADFTPAERAAAVEARERIRNGGAVAVPFKDVGQEAAKRELEAAIRSDGDKIVKAVQP